MRPGMKRVSPIRQVHVRVSAAMKKAVKMFCVREGTTEQAWVYRLIDQHLARKAPDLWPTDAKGARVSRKSKAQ
jgi:hypothetical protein